LARPIIELDRSQVSDLEAFWDEVSRSMITDVYWGRNLDGFNDILRGGFGTPEGGFVLQWVHSAASREALGYPETARYLAAALERCHPTGRPTVAAALAAARRREGPTLFDTLVEIIRDHSPGGTQEADQVELELA
jgi:RNAse (barnase) inhibitor barstar